MKCNTIMIALLYLVGHKIITEGNVITILLPCLVTYLISNGINFTLIQLCLEIFFIRLSILLFVFFFLIIIHDIMSKHCTKFNLIKTTHHNFPNWDKYHIITHRREMSPCTKVQQSNNSFLTQFTPLDMIGLAREGWWWLWWRQAWNNLKPKISRYRTDQIKCRKTKETPKICPVSKKNS